MRFLLDTIRRILTAALVIVLLACAVEVALRIAHLRDRPDAEAQSIPRLTSRVTHSELPAVWTGQGRDAESGQPIPWRVNSLGLRGPEISARKPSGTLRIILLGDDTLLADGLAEEATCPGQLASRLSNRIAQPIEVINAGLPAGCPLTELIHYRRLLSELRPDLVLLHVDLSDADDDRSARRTLRTDDAGWPVAVVHPTLDSPPGLLNDVSNQFQLGAWLTRQLGTTLAAAPAASPQARFEQQLLAWSAREGETSSPPVLEPIAQLKLLLDQTGTRLVVSTFPSAWQTAELLRAGVPGGGSNDLLNRPAALLVATCRAWEIDCVDATPEVLRSADPSQLFLPGGGSLSSQGQSLYADVLSRALTNPVSPPSAVERTGWTR